MLSNERLLKLYRDMVMIRRFEEVIETYAANGTVPDSYISPLARRPVGRRGGLPEEDRL